MSTTAKIAAKGCTSTGITEELAESLRSRLGQNIVAVVELVSEARSEKRNGDESVVLNILTVEPAPNSTTEDHLRELARAFYYERKLHEDGPQLGDPDDGPAPKIGDVINQGKGVLTETEDGEPRLVTDADLADAQLDLDPDDPAHDDEPDDEPQPATDPTTAADDLAARRRRDPFTA